MGALQTCLLKIYAYRYVLNLNLYLQREDHRFAFLKSERWIGNCDEGKVLQNAAS